jgi:uncharacterized protein (UPF0332 family)
MLDDLLKEGYLKRIRTNKGMVEESLKIAERDLIVAREIIKTDTDWAFNIAYNSILQAIRSLMFKKGYRPSSRNSHIAVVKFAAEYLPKNDVLYLERMRRKRHRAVYDMVGITSLTEAQNGIKKAEKILNTIKSLVTN